MPEARNTVVRFVGGPLDGAQLAITREPEAPLFIDRLTGENPRKMAVYEFSDRDGNPAERTYLFFETMEAEEGAAFVGKHGGMGPPPGEEISK
jgi:hypothetical protein